MRVHKHPQGSNQHVAGKRKRNGVPRSIREAMFLGLTRIANRVHGALSQTRIAIHPGASFSGL